MEVALWGPGPRALTLVFQQARHHSSPLGFLILCPGFLPSLCPLLQCGWDQRTPVPAHTCSQESCQSDGTRPQRFHDLLMALTASHHLASPPRPHSYLSDSHRGADAPAAAAGGHPSLLPLQPPLHPTSSLSESLPHTRPPGYLLIV